MPPPLLKTIIDFWRRCRHVESASLATAGLLVVLITLPTLALMGAATSFGAGRMAKRASEIDFAYDQARYSVGAEESLERKYRLEPSARVRQAHAREATSLVMSLQKVRSLEPDSAKSIDALVAIHAAYLTAIDRMFSAVDAKDIARSNEIDEADGDPTFDALERQIDAAADDHRRTAMFQLDRLERIQRVVLFATPAAFGVGLALIVFFNAVLRRYRRQTVEATVRANRQNELRFRSLVRHSSDVILVCDAQQKIVYQAPTAASEDSSGAALLGGTLEALTHPEDRAALRATWRQICGARDVSRTIGLRVRNGKGPWHHTECSLTNLIQECAVGGVVVSLRDVTERKNFEKQLTQQAFYDSLTGLPNRALLRERIGHAIVRASLHCRKIGLIFIDLDDFKRVNDSLGHDQGDVLLVAAARRLETCIRSSDTVARLGGDEFVILLDQLTSDGTADANLVAERVINQFEIPFALNNRDYVVSASMGIALAEGVTINADTLLRDADVAMYRAKSSGKSRYVMFDTDMRVDAVERLALETELRQAIQSDELRIHFQPILHLETGRLREVEALVRWQHPIRGLVAPAEFIPIAEETGLVVSIGRFVLANACKQVARWQKEFPLEPALQVSVNLSPRQFEDPGLVDDVMRALRNSGIPSGSLKLEVTEGIIMRDIEASIQTLHKLKAQGIQIAIDDFGTGYSSLSYLKRLPLDVLKIDRSFVQGIGTNPEDDAIVQAIISLAQSLDLSVTAEGIETEAQARCLREWSCERGQGFLFARPLDAADVNKFLQKPGDVSSSRVGFSASVSVGTAEIV